MTISKYEYAFLALTGVGALSVIHYTGVVVHQAFPNTHNNDIPFEAFVDGALTFVLIALVLFLVVWIGVGVRVFGTWLSGKRQECETA